MPDICENLISYQLPDISQIDKKRLLIDINSKVTQLSKQPDKDFSVVIQKYYNKQLQTLLKQEEN